MSRTSDCASADLLDSRISPIGEPIPDLGMHLLGEDGQPVPEGTPGELYIAGPGLARGYLNRPELAAERFVREPAVRGERLYKTGDRAVRLPDGGFAYAGRSDDQAKVRGFRVEPAEIEACLSGHPAIDRAVVVKPDHGEGDARLIAYLTPRPHLDLIDELLMSVTEELGRTAAEFLPSYMRPPVSTSGER